MASAWCRRCRCVTAGRAPTTAEVGKCRQVTGRGEKCTPPVSRACHGWQRQVVSDRWCSGAVAGRWCGGRCEGRQAAGKMPCADSPTRVQCGAERGAGQVQRHCSVQNRSADQVAAVCRGSAALGADAPAAPRCVEGHHHTAHRTGRRRPPRCR
jgi:hypothetical protein